MKCRLCGIKLTRHEVDYCSTCRAFLDWKYGKEVHARLEEGKNEGA